MHIGKSYAYNKKLKSYTTILRTNILRKIVVLDFSFFMIGYNLIPRTPTPRTITSYKHFSIELKLC